MGETVCFRVVKEPYGWAVRIGAGSMTSFQTRVLAVRQANSMARALRERGEAVEVVIDEPRTIETPERRRRPRHT